MIDLLFLLFKDLNFLSYFNFMYDIITVKTYLSNKVHGILLFRQIHPIVEFDNELCNRKNTFIKLSDSKH